MERWIDARPFNVKTTCPPFIKNKAVIDFRFRAGNRGLSVLSVPTYARCVPTYEREQR